MALVNIVPFLADLTGGLAGGPFYKCGKISRGTIPHKICDVSNTFAGSGQKTYSNLHAYLGQMLAIIGSVCILHDPVQLPCADVQLL